MTETYIDPTREQFGAFARADIDGPIVMINLLRFDPDGGAERYAQYVEAAGPFLEKVGASVRYTGDAMATVIGGEDWDEVLLVEYPSRQAFIDMIRDPDYPSAIRTSAVLDSRLICTSARSA